MRSFAMLPLAQFLPVPAGQDSLKSYAAWPVWSGSTTKEIRFQPMAKKKAVQLWHRARDFDRKTRIPGQHGGRIGHSALQVLHALIFDHLDYRTGALEPSYASIARMANVCQRTVATALLKLKVVGILNWVRRCAETFKDGRFVLEQQTNAYAVLPCSQWRGYTPPPEPPPPMPGTWGDHPPLPSPMAQYSVDRRDGASMESAIRALEADPTDELAKVLARLGRALPKADHQ